MTTAQLLLLVLSITIASLGLVYLGWTLSTKRFRQRDRRRNATVHALEQQVDKLTDDLTSDQVRVGIDVGRDYVVSEVQSTLDRITGRERA